jgi:hypothetical protein
VGIFGGSYTIGNQESSQVARNDVELMQIVAGNAMRCGYLLV